MGKARPPALVLDAGALIAFERADPRMRVLAREALRGAVRFVVTAGVVGQVVRNPTRRVPLRALLDASATTVVPLHRALAEAAGILCGRAGTADVIDASVVLTARQERAVILTSDVDDLRRLDPEIELERI